MNLTSAFLSFLPQASPYLLSKLYSKVLWKCTKFIILPLNITFHGEKLFIFKYCGLKSLSENTSNISIMNKHERNMIANKVKALTFNLGCNFCFFQFLNTTILIKISRTDNICHYIAVKCLQNLSSTLFWILLQFCWEIIYNFCWFHLLPHFIITLLKFICIIYISIKRFMNFV